MAGRSVGIPIDTSLLEGQPQPTRRTGIVGLPTVGFTGENSLSISALIARARPGSVAIRPKLSCSVDSRLEKGRNQIRVSQRHYRGVATEITPA